MKMEKRNKFLLLPDIFLLQPAGKQWDEETLNHP